MYSKKKLPVIIALILSVHAILIISCSDSGTGAKDEQLPFPSTGKYEGEYWPTLAWRSCVPSEAGMDSAKLMLAYDYAADPELYTLALVIIKDGYIVGEAYFNGMNENSLLDAYSITKNFTSAVVGIALDKGVIRSLDDFAYEYIPQWDQAYTPAIKKRVKLRHLLTMTGGLDWNRDSSATDDFLMHNYEDYLAYVLSKDVVVEPGTEWFYSNGEAMLWSTILSEAKDMTFETYAYHVLQAKIGIPYIYWRHDSFRNTNTAYGLTGTARDIAKFAYLYLNKGKWDDEQVVPEAWVRESTSPASEEIYFYGYYWWLPRAFASYYEYEIPDSSFFGSGAAGQRLYVVPEKNLVMVRMAAGADTGEHAWDTLKFLSLVLDAINE